MANFTKKAIKETFMELLEERPLTDITVKDIVETCGINRNSFYYHFQDLPSLVDEVVEEEAENIIRKYPAVDSMVQCFDALIEFSSSHKKAIMHIYRSVSRDAFEQNLISVSEYLVSQYLSNVLSGTEIRDADKKAAVEYYKYACVGLILGWLNSGMSDEYAQEIRRIVCIRQNYTAEIAGFIKTQE